LTPKATPVDRALEIARELVDLLEAKKADDILLLDLQEVCSFADYFVLASGISERTLEALKADSVQHLKKARLKRIPSVEGSAAGGWVLVDAGDVVLHLFSPRQRKYYQLEELWKAGRVLLHLQ
jgi:ribosome-associated protein